MNLVALDKSMRQPSSTPAILRIERGYAGPALAMLNIDGIPRCRCNEPIS